MCIQQPHTLKYACNKSQHFLLPRRETETFQVALPLCNDNTVLKHYGANTIKNMQDQKAMLAVSLLGAPALLCIPGLFLPGFPHSPLPLTLHTARHWAPLTILPVFCLFILKTQGTHVFQLHFQKMPLNHCILKICTAETGTPGSG